MKMRVAVVIPNYNGEHLLGPCLDSLAAQTAPAARVVVADNGSSDASVALAQTHPVKPLVIRLGANLGFARAANAGAAAAPDCDLLALLNNDAVAAPGWLAAGLDALAQHPVAASVASLVLSAADRGVVDSAGDFLGRDFRPAQRGRGRPAAEVSTPVEVLSACACAAFYRREAFDRAGGFAESFFAYLEDVDLGLRLRAAGGRCLFWPAAVVTHLGAATDLGDRPGRNPTDSSDRVFAIARNRVRLILRTLPGGKLIAHSPWVLAGLARGAGYHLFRSGQAGPFLRGLSAGWARAGEDRALAAQHFGGGGFEAIAAWIGTEARPWSD